jgi:hypothetical protein
VLQPLIGRNVFVYLDDIIIFSKTREQHRADIIEVLETLRKANFKLNLKKCQFKIKFPDSKKDLQKFLGLCNYYRRFIPQYSSIAEPLYNLLRNDTAYEFDDQCKSAFFSLKEKLSNTPILGFPTNNGQFTLHTDASTVGIAGVLSQSESGKQKTICYLSRTLSSAERNYSTTEKECLAIVWCIKNLRHYLMGRKFVVRSFKFTMFEKRERPDGSVGQMESCISKLRFRNSPQGGNSNKTCRCLIKIADH